MNNEVLLELAARWERDARPVGAEDGSEEARIGNAVQQGQRECKRECADTLRTLVKMLGD
ncbi:hypothetical protein KA005_65865 [bacterium]|nr:hypothetical protein [bacterium]